MKEVVIVSAVRTPIGSFGGSLASVNAAQLGATAIKGALNKINLDPKEVQEVFMGNVLQANVGQAPARQAAIFAGIGNNVPCTTVNKVCSSGMKSVMLAAQTIKAGDNDVVIAGGMENMSAVPHYLPTGRNGVKLGDIQLVDGLVKDGLTDVYQQTHMGVCADLCATDMKFTREEQDAFALESYRRSAAAWEAGNYSNEVVPVEIPQRRGEPVVMSEDEEYKNLRADKVASLRPVFSKDGTVTAANASTLNDGAAALVLMSREKAESLGLKPIAVVRGYADAAHEPEWFTTAPAKAVPAAIAKAGLTKEDIQFYELNEAFSVVGLANMKLLGITPEQTNVNGGAVSIGHPLGASGARILVTLINVLEQNNAKYGAAGICNGGGGASAVVIERV
ncbi:acetyl-CoA C-acyltransferase [Phaeocystidibacter marisrubri]|uniref:acetyl-CoA C-acetyltransferase n=1 Tax=Phaeocystidibacter marisrubri TaxID=1577780 RepID=A0A6L3ZD42_9FLAO|nr:acetyl-CoA C-acyltransferase [Phaeocystidibacter marisrubri]KAB2815566.1 acetyl-CoA C-acyltransferase [Phaeocystidibacter marisrubri]GGH64567.1 acetyl-CoA acetyltransferase [Phaeocystidibacter marisrubri]